MKNDVLNAPDCVPYLGFLRDVAASRHSSNEFGSALDFATLLKVSIFDTVEKSVCYYTRAKLKTKKMGEALPSFSLPSVTPALSIVIVKLSILNFGIIALRIANPYSILRQIANLPQRREEAEEA